MRTLATWASAAASGGAGAGWSRGRTIRQTTRRRTRIARPRAQRLRDARASTRHRDSLRAAPGFLSGIVRRAQSTTRGLERALLPRTMRADRRAVRELDLLQYLHIRAYCWIAPLRSRVSQRDERGYRRRHEGGRGKDAGESDEAPAATHRALDGARVAQRGPVEVVEEPSRSERSEDARAREEESDDDHCDT